MKKLRLLMATIGLVCLLAINTLGGDGIMNTGGDVAPPPPPPPTSAVANDAGPTDPDFFVVAEMLVLNLSTSIFAL